MLRKNDEVSSLSHTKRDCCKRHVVSAPKCRRKAIYVKPTADAELAALMEGMERNPERLEGMCKSEIAEFKAGFGVICLITNCSMEPADVYSVPLVQEKVEARDLLRRP